MELPYTMKVSLKKNFAVSVSRKVKQKRFAELVNFIDVPPYSKKFV